MPNARIMKMCDSCYGEDIIAPFTNIIMIDEPLQRKS